VIAGLVFIAIAIAVVVGFVVVSVRNADRYAESLRPPPDLRRADQWSNPTSGNANGGSIWPDNK
jgi:hypothetical protein